MSELWENGDTTLLHDAIEFERVCSSSVPLLNNWIRYSHSDEGNAGAEESDR